MQTNFHTDFQASQWASSMFLLNAQAPEEKKQTEWSLKLPPLSVYRHLLLCFFTDRWQQSGGKFSIRAGFLTAMFVCLNMWAYLKSYKGANNNGSILRIKPFFWGKKTPQHLPTNSRLLYFFSNTAGCFTAVLQLDLTQLAMISHLTKNHIPPLLQHKQLAEE